MYWLKSKSIKSEDNPEIFFPGEISNILINTKSPKLQNEINEITEIVGITETKISRFR